MRTNEIDRTKIIVQDGWRIKDNSAVRLYRSIGFQKPHGIESSDDTVNFRIEVGKNPHITGSPCVACRFESIPLSSIIGSVSISAQDLIGWRYPEQRPRDYREIPLQLILENDLRQVIFKVTGTKYTCTLWFGCIMTRPTAIIPKEQVSELFEKESL